MNDSLKQKAEQLVHCLHLAKILGYEDVEYSHTGYSLMKNGRVAKPFASLDEAETWLEGILEARTQFISARACGKTARIKNLQAFVSRV